MLNTLNLIISIFIISASIKHKKYCYSVTGILVAVYTVIRSVFVSDPELLNVCGIAERILILVVAVSFYVLFRDGLTGKYCVLFGILAAVVRWCWFPVSSIFRNIMQNPDADVYGLFKRVVAIYNGFDIAVGALLLTAQILLWLNLRKYRNNPGK